MGTTYYVPSNFSCRIHAEKMLQLKRMVFFRLEPRLPWDPPLLTAAMAFLAAGPRICGEEASFFFWGPQRPQQHPNMGDSILHGIEYMIHSTWYINERILQGMISGISVVFGSRSGIWDPYLMWSFRGPLFQGTGSDL